MQGLVNGVLALPLNPTSVALPLTCSISSTPGCYSFGSWTYVDSAPDTDRNVTQIGIRLTFDLGPGDSGDIESRFQLVPEPGTLLLLGGGIAGLVMVGRSKRS
jgi:hypothetical protein